MRAMFRIAALALALILAGPALLTGPSAQTAQSQPQARPPGQASERDWLFQALRTAPTEQLGRVVEDQIWWYWMRQAPDADSAAMMRAAQKRRTAYDYAGAIEILDKLVAHAPGWAAAWNERATVLFLQEHYDRALEDVARTLALEPRHFGALAGEALIYFRQGRAELAQKALRRAVAIDPWLRERGMLATRTPGKDL